MTPKGVGGTGGEGEKSSVRHAARSEDGQDSDRVSAIAVRHRHDAAFRDLVAPELVADLDGGLLARHRIGHQIVEGLLLLDNAYDRTQFPQIVKLRLIEEILGPGEEDVRLLGIYGAVEGALHGRPQILAEVQLFDDRVDLVADFEEPLPGQASVQSVREAREVVGVHVGRQVEHVLRRDTERGHDDRKSGPRAQPNQLDMAERLRLAHRRYRDREVLREAGKEARRLLDDALELAAGGLELVLDPPRVFGIDRL